MKLSVSLPAEDVEFLDAYAREHRSGSRSAALRQALVLLRASMLAPEYENAWAEWAESGEGETAWAVVVADGLTG